MSQESLGYQISYRALADLAQDQASYFSRGGMVVQWLEALPAPGVEVLLRLLIPGGQYELRGHVDRVVEGRGFTVLFDAATKSALVEIERLVASPAFQGAVAAEDASLKDSRQITRIGAPAPRDAYDDYEFEDAATRMDAAESQDVPAQAEPEVAAVSAGDDASAEPDPNEEIGTQHSDDEDAPPPSFRVPGPGDSYVVYVVKFATLLDYLEVLPRFSQDARFVVPHAGETAAEGGLAQLRITLPGRNMFTMHALIETVRPDSVVLLVSSASQAYQAASTFPKTHNGVKRLQNERPDMRRPVEVIRFEEKRSNDDPDSMPLRRRIQRMSMDDKINLALSGTREERMALAMDGNKAIHHYLLKNARISLDEVAFIARLPTMNPDVLAKIGENPAYTQNPTVLKNLVYNPKTPVTIAIRLLDRLPRSEVMNLSKRVSMNAKLVQAAKKKIEGRAK